MYTVLSILLTSLLILLREVCHKSIVFRLRLNITRNDGKHDTSHQYTKLSPERQILHCKGRLCFLVLIGTIPVIGWSIFANHSLATLYCTPNQSPSCPFFREGRVECADLYFFPACRRDRRARCRITGRQSIYLWTLHQQKKFRKT